MSHDIVARLEEGLKETVAEILNIAQEDEADKVGAQQFLTEAKYHHASFEQYTLELLKAFGCSALELDYDDQQSREKILDLERQYPNFSWAKHVYLREFDLSDINPNLLDNPQLQLITQERLKHWVA